MRWFSGYRSREEAGMMKYYGVAKDDVVFALSGMIELLETYGAGPESRKRVAALRQKDASGLTVIDLLKEETDPRAFADLVEASGLRKLNEDAFSALQVHAHLDSDGKGRKVFRILTSVGMASGVCRSLLDPGVREWDIWAGAAYAEKLTGVNRLMVAWRDRGGRPASFRPEDAVAAGSVERIRTLKNGPIFREEAAALLSALKPVDLYFVVSRLARLCGFDDEGRDVRGRSPMKHYFVALNVPEKASSAEALETTVLQERIYSLAESFASATETDFLTRSVEGRALRAASSDGRIVLGDGACTLGVGFRATDEAARKIAGAFPQVQVVCAETRKAVRPAGRR